jgi:hypothetical protein
MDGLFNVIEALEIDQPIYIMMLGETFGSTGFMLVNPTNEVVGTPM